MTEIITFTVMLDAPTHRLAPDADARRYQPGDVIEPRELHADAEETRDKWLIPYTPTVPHTIFLHVDECPDGSLDRFKSVFVLLNEDRRSRWFMDFPLPVKTTLESNRQECIDYDDAIIWLSEKEINVVLDRTQDTVKRLYRDVP